MSNFIKEAIVERDRVAAYLAVLDNLIANAEPAKIAKSQTTKGSGKFPNKKAAVHSMAIDCIREQGGPANAATIFDYVTKHGVKISRNVLKNYLYKFDDLKSDGRKGFVIKR